MRTRRATQVMEGEVGQAVGDTQYRDVECVEPDVRYSVATIPTPLGKHKFAIRRHYLET